MSVYSIGEFSKKVNISVGNLQRLDRENIFKAHRTLTGRRWYDDAQIEQFLTKKITNKVLEDSQLYASAFINQ